MCNFSIDFSGDASTFIKKCEEAIDDVGRSFAGDTSAGTFNVPSPFGRIKGIYSMSNASPVEITISKKPAIVSCSEIKTMLRKYING